MTLIQPELPSSFDEACVYEIRRRLFRVKEEYDATVLFAIESGSRAWGFPSPDSDYDCRFVYARPAIQHLALEPVRDVIEFPIEGLIDTGGWDLRKSLLLALKGNAVIYEWVMSPICYLETPGFRTEFRRLLDEIIDPVLVAKHYVGLLKTQVSRFDLDSKEVPLKKLFYAIRPIVCLMWMQESSFKALPPMSMPDALKQISISTDARQAIKDLIALKEQTRELGTGPIPKALTPFLDRGIETGQQILRMPAHDPKHDTRRLTKAEDFYRRTILEYV